jgi:hypothetical protein
MVRAFPKLSSVKSLATDSSNLGNSRMESIQSVVGGPSSKSKVSYLVKSVMTAFRFVRIRSLSDAVGGLGLGTSFGLGMGGASSSP